MAAIALPACMVFSGAARAGAQTLSVVPAPLSVTKADGTLTIRSSAVIAYPRGDAAAQFAAEHLAELAAQTRHLQLTPQVAHSGSTALIQLTRTPVALDQLARTPAAGGEQTQSEAYDLEVTPRGVTISAPGDAGLYYGTVTLWQMLTAETLTGPARLQCVHIHDEPQLRWRGIMLDSARHMQSIATIRQLIDWMSLEKLNVLHWHLTDDQGWRLEIKRYPKLTQAGAWRQLPSPDPARTAADAKTHRYGGYYTQEQVRALVAYAAKRNVMIVPEIEMPGHASAALAAYPEFGSSEERLQAPANWHGIFPNLYNVNDATFTFIEDVLTEVMQLFPSPFIHVGGDEAIKNQWKASPAIQAQMKQLGISDEDALQSYFIKRIDAFLTAHGRRTIGWDEILQGGLAGNAAVMSWHGVQGAIDAARQGHDAVLTPVHPLYFNYRQSDAAGEAPGRAVLNTLADVYAFNPEPDSLTPEQRKHILGVQGNLWSEYVITKERDEWMLFPRTAALAEIGWSPAAQRDWNGFLARMVDETRRYQALGIHFDPALYRVRSTETLTADQTHVSVGLSNQTNYGVLRYTTDGSAVTAGSAEYTGPLTLPLPAHLRAAAFSDSAIGNGALTGSELDRELDALSVRRRYSQQMKLCVSDPAIAMEPDPPQQNAPVVLTNFQKPCWIYPGAELTKIRAVSAGVVPLAYVFRDKDGKLPPLGEPHTPHGEFEVHLDTCSGKIVATLPFPDDGENVGVNRLRAPLDGLEGTHDLCFQEARPNLDPLWVLDWVQLEPR